MGCDTTGSRGYNSPVGSVILAWKQSRTEFRSNSSSHTLDSGTMRETREEKGGENTDVWLWPASCQAGIWNRKHSLFHFYKVWRLKRKVVWFQCRTIEIDEDNSDTQMVTCRAVQKPTTVKTCSPVEIRSHSGLTAAVFWEELITNVTLFLNVM